LPLVVLLIPWLSPVGSFLNSWLKDVALPNMTPRTYEGYEFNINKYLVPKIGDKPLLDLKAEDIPHLLAEIQAAGHNRTAKYCYDTLNKALNLAIKHGVIVRNPCEGVEIPRVPRHEMIVMDENSELKFLEAAKKTPYYALFYTALFSGMRRSEFSA
jgi:integrase